EELAQFEARLTAEVEEGYAAIKRNLDEVKPVSLDEPIGRLSRVDALQRQQISQASRARIETSIASARSALARLRSGEFGICRVCGEEISSQRLRHSPSVSLCLECQRSQLR